AGDNHDITADPFKPAVERQNTVVIMDAENVDRLAAERRLGAPQPEQLLGKPEVVLHGSAGLYAVPEDQRCTGVRVAPGFGLQAVEVDVGRASTSGLRNDRADGLA